MRTPRWLGPVGACGVVALLLGIGAKADDARDARSLGLSMVRDLKTAVKARYFDPGFRGLDVDELFARTEARVRQATSQAQLVPILAQTMAEFHDSHTYFIPPVRAFDIDYGFEARMVGDDALIVDVVKGSDAERQGIQRGDRLLSVEGTSPSRENFAPLFYALNIALPRKQLDLSLQRGDDPPRRLTVEARIEPRPRKIDLVQWLDEMTRRVRSHSEYAWRYWTYEKEKVVVARLYTFMVTEELVNELMSKVHDARALILDLRGNPGGSIEALQTAAGAFFENEIELGTQKERKTTRPFRSRRPKSKRLFTGTLVVLVDSASASSAEILARVVQIEKRGSVVGDRTAGTVMVAEQVTFNAGNQLRLILYGASVTVADLLLKDGRSLEGQGVLPDELVLPSPSDLRDGRDPAMARAAKLAGLDLSPEAAYSHFHPALKEKK